MKFLFTSQSLHDIEPLHNMILSKGWSELYISKFDFNRSRRRTRILLSNPHALHAQVLESFSPSQATESELGRVLWRVDQGEHSQSLLIVSPERPDLTGFVESSGWPSTETWQTRDYQTRIDSIKAGQQWAFRFVGNPVSSKRIHAPDLEKRPRGVRTPHVTAAQQKDWFLNSSGSFGFSCVTGDRQTVEVSNRKELRFSKSSTRTDTTKSRLITLRTAQFDGLLTIVDAARFRHALTFGMGPGKGYGCGLLTIAPLAPSNDDHSGR